MLKHFNSKIKSLLAYLWLSFAALLIFVAVMSSIMRALTPMASHYKQELASQLSLLLGEKITIGTIETDWHWFEPVIKLSQVRIGTKVYQQINIKKMTVGIDLLESLWLWKIQPGMLSIDGMSLNVRQKNNQWIINSLIDYQANLAVPDERFTEQVVAWFLRHDKLSLNHINCNFFLDNGVVIPVSNLSVFFESSGLHHSVKAKWLLSQTTKSLIELVGKFEAKGNSWQNIKGELYLSAQNIVISQWLNGLLPKSIQAGSGIYNGSAWIKFKQAMVDSVQAKLDLSNLSLSNKTNRTQTMMQRLVANLYWKKNAEGWELTGDNIDAKIANKQLTKNRLKIQRKQWKSHVYLDFIDLESLLAIVALTPWHPQIKSLLPQGATGVFKAINLSFNRDDFDKLSLAFHDLSWKRQEQLPAVNHLSGALSAEPKQGFVALSSKSVALSFQNEQSLLLKRLQGMFQWNRLSHGWRLSAQRILLESKNFIITSRFNWDEFEKGLSSQLRINGEYSGSQIHELKQYIPYAQLKPKLAQWLKSAIKKIPSASGSFYLSGRLSEFPFDKGKGQFKINSHVSDAVLTFAPNWPGAHNIDAELMLDKRVLSVELNKAYLQDILVKQLNLKITDLGLDKEVLYLHGKTNAETEKALSYLSKSPLAQHFSALKGVNIKGRVNLDLNLQIPLNPFDDLDLAKGSVSFEDNQWVPNRWWQIPIHGIKGAVYFDQEGILDGHLNAKLLGFPVEASVVTRSEPQKFTQITVTGHASVAAIARQFNWAEPDFIKGIFSYKLSSKITDKTDDLDTSTLTSDLSGVVISLPEPLAKTGNQKTKFKLSVKYSLGKQLLVSLHYTPNLSALFKFIPVTGGFQLDRGEVRLGSRKPILPASKSVRIVGSLSQFDWGQWRELFTRQQGYEASKIPVNLLNYVDVIINKLSVAGQEFKKIEIKLIKALKSWKVKLKSDRVSGQLTVQWPQKVSAELSHLALELPEGEKEFNEALLPEEIPKLSVTVKQLFLDKVLLGRFDLQTKAAVGKQASTIDRLSLIAPYWELESSGKWWHQQRKHQTELKGTVRVHNLAMALTQWGKIPVIDSKQGLLRFDLGWPANPWHFSLEKLKGEARLDLKKGRITNLDEETEEKIGLGKLLSILSLQTLPRRLVLDFSDLSQKGYSFDKFSGNFLINQGLLSTKNSQLDGPVAYVTMRGDLNLANQSYDLVLQVSPHITASLPVVATIAGGPVAGVATWVASKILNQSVLKVTAYTYKITGPWEKPVVQQLSISHR